MIFIERATFLEMLEGQWRVLDRIQLQVLVVANDKDDVWALFNKGRFLVQGWVQWLLVRLLRMRERKDVLDR